VLKDLTGQAGWTEQPGYGYFLAGILFPGLISIALLK
jgi:hypothetical protein